MTLPIYLLVLAFLLVCILGLTEKAQDKVFGIIEDVWKYQNKNDELSEE